MVGQQNASQQLRMFMSPREIMSEYQPLDNDRLHADEAFGDYSGSSRPRFASKDVPTHPSSRINAGIRSMIRSGDIEGDSELWERKAEEADYDYSPSLQSQIESEGVRKPIHLSEQFGVMGKRMVAGGHHRIAAANDVNPDMLMPVVHHRSFGEARFDYPQRRRDYPYS